MLPFMPTALAGIHAADALQGLILNF